MASAYFSCSRCWFRSCSGGKNPWGSLANSQGLRSKMALELLRNQPQQLPSMSMAKRQLRFMVSSNKLPNRETNKITPEWEAVKPEGTAAATEATPAAPSSFLQRFLGPKEMPERYTLAWYKEIILICTVFGITGTSTMMIVRPAVKDILGIDGTFRDGPWSYRLCSLFLISPVYATLLVGVGTVFGRHAYFRHFSVKIFSRFGIPPELLDKNWKIHQKNFKRW